MKKSFLIISLLSVLILSWCGDSNVVEYNDNLVAIVKECTDSTQALLETYNSEGVTVDSIQESLQKWITVCQNAELKANKLWDYEKDSSLKDWVIDLFSTQIQYLEKFWLTSRYRNIDNITDDDKLAYDAVVGELYQLEPELNLKFLALQEIQEAFAAKHWLKLE